ncbi:hypothetical protein ABBQ38_009988 [Trebouxia sp. C0009 RCD-2024]
MTLGPPLHACSHELCVDQIKEPRACGVAGRIPWHGCGICVEPVGHAGGQNDAGGTGVSHLRFWVQGQTRFTKQQQQQQ